MDNGVCVCVKRKTIMLGLWLRCRSTKLGQSILNKKNSAPSLRLYTFAFVVSHSIHFLYCFFFLELCTWHKRSRARVFI